MHEAPLTQHAIDNGTAISNNHGSGLYAKLARHPYLAGGAMLASAGIAFAAATFAKAHSDHESSETTGAGHLAGSLEANVGPQHPSRPRSTTKRGAKRAVKTNPNGRRAKQH
jgi:hypothetical protein